MDSIALTLSKELGKPAELVANVISLLDEGNTIPFIARYRKEAHGAMDDTTLRELEERLKYLRNLQARKEEVIRLIEEAGKLTTALADSIQKAATLAEVEALSVGQTVDVVVLGVDEKKKRISLSIKQAGV